MSILSCGVCDFVLWYEIFNCNAVHARRLWSSLAYSRFICLIMSFVKVILYATLFKCDLDKRSNNSCIIIVNLRTKLTSSHLISKGVNLSSLATLVVWNYLPREIQVQYISNHWPFPMYKYINKHSRYDLLYIMWHLLFLIESYV